MKQFIKIIKAYFRKLNLNQKTILLKTTSYLSNIKAILKKHGKLLKKLLVNLNIQTKFLGVY